MSNSVQGFNVASLSVKLKAELHFGLAVSTTFESERPWNGSVHARICSWLGMFAVALSVPGLGEEAH